MSQILQILIINELTPPYIEAMSKAYKSVIHEKYGYKRNRSNDNLEILRHAFLHIALKILNRQPFCINLKYWLS